MSRKRGHSIAADLAARVLFRADRTCCVCRSPGKPVQIHHIDEDPTHSAEVNLAVLCLACHADTQISGGFHRKLDADQVVLYRDDWNLLVAQHRAAMDIKGLIDSGDNPNELRSLTNRLDVLLERKKYSSLAIDYDIIGNAALRDKYIELALKDRPSDDEIIYFRWLQGRPDLIPDKVKQREIKRRRSRSDWSQLARLYSHIGKHKDAAVNYCRSIIESLEEGNVFSAAFYLKELGESDIHARLFELAYRKHTQSKDLWWRVRALQELGWEDELRSVLLKNRKTIEKSRNLMLLAELYEVTGETERLEEVQRELAEHE